MEYAAIKSAVEKLNASGATESKIKTVAAKAEDVKTNFIKTIGDLGLEKTQTLDKDIILAFVHVVGAFSDADYAALDESIRAVYDGLPDEYFNAPAEGTAEGAAPTENAAPAAEGAPAENAASAAPAAPKAPKAPKEPKKPGDKGYKSDCADFGKNCDDSATICQTCKTAKPDEYTVCAEKTAAKKAKKKPDAPVRAKNELGHVIGSMSADIDTVFLAGPCYADDVVKMLMEKHPGKDAAKAKEKLKSHISWLVNREGHKVAQTVEGEGDSKRVKIVFTKGATA